jgi:hypothetical protein
MGEREEAGKAEPPSIGPVIFLVVGHMMSQLAPDNSLSLHAPLLLVLMHQE